MFLDNVFLKILVSPNSTYAHKRMALQVLCKLCQDPQTVVEIFLNYDCELGHSNIFQGALAHTQTCMGCGSRRTQRHHLGAGEGRPWQNPEALDER